MSKLVRVSDQAWDRLTVLVRERQEATGRAVSYGEVIEKLLDHLEEVMRP